MLETVHDGDNGITVKPRLAAGASAAISPAEWEARVELAALYRAVDHMGWGEITSNHITLGVPDQPGCYLINPHGLRYDEVTASNLVKIHHDGSLAAPSDHGINLAGYVIHGAIHEARPDAACVVHTHTIADNAVSALDCGLLPLNQTSALLYGHVAAHEFEGVAVNMEERERLARDLGDKPLMLLRNHGMLAIGGTVAEAFLLTFYFQRACEMQVATLSCNAPYNTIPHAIAAKTAAAFLTFYRATPCLDWLAIRRKLDRIDPGYRE